tara:strand:+ start:761 stop:1765 length:1005 start_codon:yes stop_codon:yes gene_type:complete
MIIKSHELKKNIDKNINYYLLYGNNSGLIEENVNNVLKPNFSQNVIYYDEHEILDRIDTFREEIFNKSFFENDKLIIINRVSDKILNLIDEMVDKKIDDLKIVLKAGILEKKSKLRNFFEKQKNTIIVPFYEDTNQSLQFLAINFFKEKKIKISNENINLIVERSKGDRINLKNELEKIQNLARNKKIITNEEVLKITNLAENYNVSELVDQCLAKNEKKTLNILNENNVTNDENILIIKTFLFKLKRLKKLKIQLEEKNNIDLVLSSYKPPIFWKEKDLIKRQLSIWHLEKINRLINKINNIELMIKKNAQISNLLTYNFILENLKSTNNSVL